MSTMISRRTLLSVAAASLPDMAQPRFLDQIGLEIYSLRDRAAKDLPGTLALIRKMGFKEVEISALYGRSAAEFRRLLDDHGLTATSMMADHERLAKQLDGVAHDAHTLGAEYVVCGTIPAPQKALGGGGVQACSRGAKPLGRKSSLIGSSLLLSHSWHGVRQNGPRNSVRHTRPTD
jgi:hypothetical protein